jgi:hypothetical protein
MLEHGDVQGLSVLPLCLLYMGVCVDHPVFAKGKNVKVALALRNQWMGREGDITKVTAVDEDTPSGCLVFSHMQVLLGRSCMNKRVRGRSEQTRAPGLDSDFVFFHGSVRFLARRCGELISPTFMQAALLHEHGNANCFQTGKKVSTDVG